MEDYKTFNFIYKISFLGDLKYRHYYSKILDELNKTGYNFPITVKNRIKKIQQKCIY